MIIRNKKIIVTGGANGIGKNLVEKLVKENAIVGILDIDVKGLKELKRRYKNVYCKKCDISNYKDVEISVNDFFKKFKTIDVLINNAGYIYNSPLISLTTCGIKKHNIDMWHKVLATNLNSVFYMTVNVVEKMILNRTKGVIVNISSICASGNSGQSAYSAAKAGINALTSVWAKELGFMGIRIIAIAPGFTETETMKKSMSESVLKELIKKVPLRRLGKTEEISDSIICAIRNDFFNGKVIEVDGGLILSS